MATEPKAKNFPVIYFLVLSIVPSVLQLASTSATGLLEPSNCLDLIVSKLESPMGISLIFVDTPTATFAPHRSLFGTFATFSSCKINDTNQLFWNQAEATDNFGQVFLLPGNIEIKANAHRQNGVSIWISVNSVFVNAGSFPELAQIFQCTADGKILKTWCVKSNCKGQNVEGPITFRTPKNFNTAEISFVNPTLTKTSSEKAYRYVQNQRIKMFQLLLNIRPKLVYPPTVGNDDGNSWEPISNMVETNAVDLAAAPSILLPYRTQEFRFLVISQLEILRAYFQPQIDAKIHDITIAGFQISIWSTLLVQMILIAACLPVFLKFDVGNCIVGSVGVLSMQGLCTKAHLYHEQFLSSRIFIFVVNVSALMICNAFSACLIANLSNNEVVIKSLDQLLERGYNFGFKNNDSYLYASYLVGESRNSTIGKIIQSNRFRHFYETAQSRAAIKKDRKLVLLSERNLYTGSTKLSGDFNDFVVEGEKVKLAGIVLRGSVLSDPFNYALLRQWEAGLRRRLEMYEDMQELLKTPPKKVLPKARSIRLDDACVPFFISAAGILIGAILILQERFFGPVKDCRVEENSVVKCRPCTFFK